MKILILRTALLIAALAVASMPPPNAAASDCTDACGVEELECEAFCPGLGSPGHFNCLANCRLEYQWCVADCQ